jgi:hypothetical protein
MFSPNSAGEGRLRATGVGEDVADHEQAAGTRQAAARAIRSRQLASDSRWNMPDISTTSCPWPKSETW